MSTATPNYLVKARIKIGGRRRAIGARVYLDPAVVAETGLAVRGKVEALGEHVDALKAAAKKAAGKKAAGKKDDAGSGEPGDAASKAGSGEPNQS